MSAAHRYSLRRPAGLWLPIALAFALIAPLGLVIAFKLAFTGALADMQGPFLLVEVSCLAVVLATVLPWTLATRRRAFELAALAGHLLYLLLTASLVAIMILGVADTFAHSAVAGGVFAGAAIAILVSALLFALAWIARRTPSRGVYLAGAAGASVVSMGLGALPRASGHGLARALAIALDPGRLIAMAHTWLALMAFGLPSALLFGLLAYGSVRRPMAKE